ncbi:hypothetical protein PHYSODRAFT_294319 [Phytophthora sojae]|uniref:Uncharacterized protein n=1 Tax=Phytophthora sojae (strain P6497) TaxID=1094619 RepID=G4YPW1_PHYSP|nr:hypothetical protein PHYSODRAFT_294319 [Phytophthora sojae]EGZ28956.1 hypothetical protein PHYSODRAFT_294319 [Phytophthora sojae]|eukprot:XP_009516231.1 hypothetical protein PHYSODRAFT_294319 [Phytophthora sojae]
MAGMHRFWSFYEDASCSGAPTGVFIQRRNECVSQVTSSGANCVAQYDDSNALVGYVDESCHEGRAAGLDELYNGEPYMAYDYYYDTACTDYENSASYRASVDCETLYDGYSPVRSATISISNGVLTWTRNMGSIGSALKCPGSTGPATMSLMCQLLTLTPTPARTRSPASKVDSFSTTRQLPPRLTLPAPSSATQIQVQRSPARSARALTSLTLLQPRHQEARPRLTRTRAQHPRCRLHLHLEADFQTVRSSELPPESQPFSS